MSDKWTRRGEPTREDVNLRAPLGKCAGNLGTSPSLGHTLPSAHTLFSSFFFSEGWLPGCEPQLCYLEQCDRSVPQFLNL